ncbi:MAG TPA: hypothetical protein DIT67_01555 [Octadecabacter sp.]|nr:hypothetical protein [Octadecabacter sp.]
MQVLKTQKTNAAQRSKGKEGDKSLVRDCKFENEPKLAQNICHVRYSFGGGADRGAGAGYTTPHPAGETCSHGSPRVSCFPLALSPSQIDMVCA